MATEKYIETERSEVLDQKYVKVPAAWMPQKQTKQPEAPDGRDGVLSSSHTGMLKMAVVDMLGDAKHTAILSSFMLDDKDIQDAIYAATERGVAVYLMLACEKKLVSHNPYNDFDDKSLEAHVSMLNRLAGRVMVRSAPYFHSKVVLVDAIGPDTSGCRGLLSTANLTSNDLGRVRRDEGWNEELAVWLSRSEIEELVELLRWAFFEYAKHQMLNNADFEAIKPLDEVPHPIGHSQILSTTSEDNSIRKHALELIERARGELIVSSYSWEADHDITDAICKKAANGANVIILTRMREYVMPALLKMRAAGAEVFGFNWLHAKAVWNDLDEAMVMSANLHKLGLDEGFETGVKLSGDRATSLKNCLQEFQSREHFKLEADVELGCLKGVIKFWDRDSNEFKDEDVLQSITVPLNDVVAKTASSAEESPKFPEVSWKDYPAHEIMFKWMFKKPRPSQKVNKGVPGEKPSSNTAKASSAV